MFDFLKKKKNVSARVDAYNKGNTEIALTKKLDENLAVMKKLFEDVEIMRYKTFEDKNRNRYAIVFSEGVVDAAIINDNILRPIMAQAEIPEGEMERLVGEVVQINESKLSGAFKDIITSVSYGDTILFADGSKEAAILNTKSFPVRAIDEPDSEKNLAGPREGFTEAIMQNFSMLRRRARTNDLKVRQLSLGRRTHTTVLVCYLGELVKGDVLNELMRRLNAIDMDGVLDSNYVSEMINDHKRSLFRTIGTTEKPDVVISKLLEGRIAILVDGSPNVLTVPFLWVENFQASEDYYLNYYYTSFSRMLRMLGFFMTIAVPGIYVATVAFHHEMLPTSLLINISIERQNVPLPAGLECFVLLIVFEILRETGVRMPTNIGQALSIVGALVIGQAAVEAKLVAAPMIIVVGITGITNLLCPKIRSPIVYIRLFVLLLSSMFGFFGFTIGMSLMIIHMVKLSSFGVPMIKADGITAVKHHDDLAMRAPWWMMTQRTDELTGNLTRMANKENKDEG
ncbi:MAG: spore germination protein [Christensenellales bacterium]